MTVVFVTATGTEVGKTFVSRGLIRALKAKGRTVEPLKPVQSGYDPREMEGSDAGLLIAAAGQEVDDQTIAKVAPFRYEAPLAPHLAARREGRHIDAEAVIELCKKRIAETEDILVIEGVGGIMAPLDETRTLLDLMEAVGAPLVLVTGSYLGTISHTLTALEVLKQRGLTIAAVVISATPGSTIPLGETADTLRAFAPGIDIHVLPRVPPDQGTDHTVFQEIADKL
ncbi:Dethiobiotin synthetase [Rhodovulum sp. PH10]|uniref:dethiobiotin synthase n=1 Tax=Rhodovulum sp. PH10 TaxID=1187851 RepID=UPI00027C2917|nr:dethiobiotin synthase [Rhodovulum sp. PH10]EJW11657.1 Dethiobiotin synthetase [Rhodovulum sp. PH10]